MSDWWSNDPVVEGGPMPMARTTANWWANDPVANDPKAKVREQVTKDRAGGGWGQTIGEGIRTALNGLSFDTADEIGAAMQGTANYVTGGRVGKPYDEALAYEREYDRQVEEGQGLAAPALKIAGGLAVAPGLPVAQIFSRGIANPGLARTVADATANATAYGAAAGFAAGEGGLENRIDSAKNSVAYAAPLGAVGGAVASRYANRVQGTAPNSPLRDAQNIGVTLPQFMDGSALPSMVASKMGAIPFVGDDINTAVRAARTETGDAAQAIANRTGGGAGPQAAGEAVRDTLVDWADDGSRAIMDRIYRPVNQIMAPINGPLNNTTAVLNQMLTRQNEAANPAIGNAAVREIADAVNRGSLSFDGISTLRTRVGTLLDDSLNPDSRVDRGALRAVYGSLTRDMENMVRMAGPRAQREWTRANGIARQIAERRQALEAVVGKRGDATGESVVDRIVTMAGSKSSADAATLNQARRAAGGQVWSQVAGQALLRLGRNNANEFSPDTFVTKLSALSPEGRRLLFQSIGDRALERDLQSLFRVSQALQQFSRLGNPSGTGGVVALTGALGAAASGDMGATLATAIAGRGIANLMSRPGQVRPGNVQQGRRIVTGPELQQAISASVAAIVAHIQGGKQDSAAPLVGSQTESYPSR
jgi:hypothetical protein